MNSGMIICLCFACLWIIIALIFFLFKEKSCMLVSGFNTMDPVKRKNYDLTMMYKDFLHQFLVWIGLFLIGFVLSYIIHSDAAIIAIVVWLVLVVKDIHLDEDKAFAKYKKKNR